MASGYSRAAGSGLGGLEMALRMEKFGAMKVESKAQSQLELSLAQFSLFLFSRLKISKFPWLFLSVV